MKCFNITSTDNIKLLSELIAMESAGCTEVSIEKEDVELAVVVASYIRQIVKDSNSGCIIRGTYNHNSCIHIPMALTEKS